jgi:hypothetical protein
LLSGQEFPVLFQVSNQFDIGQALDKTAAIIFLDYSLVADHDYSPVALLAHQAPETLPEGNDG